MYHFHCYYFSYNFSDTVSTDFSKKIHPFLSFLLFGRPISKVKELHFHSIPPAHQDRTLNTSLQQCRVTRSRPVSSILHLCLAIVLLELGLLPGNDVRRTWGQETAEPSIYELTVTNSADQLLAYFSLTNGYTTQVMRALESGIAVRYVYEMDLRVPRFFRDREIARRTVFRTVSFDGLTGQYTVVLGPDAPRVVSVTSLDEIMPLVFEINDVPVTPLSRLLPGKTHILRVRVTLEKAETSLPFTGLLDLFAPWGFETKWYEIRFTY